METNGDMQLSLPSSPVVAGFWRRFGAFLIDFSLLGIVGLGAGLFLFDVFAQLGSLGRLLGFVVAAAYFGIMNSEVANGQTVGKRALRIRVVDGRDHPLSIGRSLVRFAVVGVPYFLNGAPLPESLMRGWGLVLPSVLIFGIGGSIVYLIVFNRRTRQSFHDIVSGSFVVSAVTLTSEERPRTWRGHFVITIFILGTSLVMPFVTSSLAKTPFFDDIQTTISAIRLQPDVRYASMNVGTTSVVSTDRGRTSTTYISIRAVTDRPLASCPDLADRCARVVVNTYPQAEKKDRIRIVVSYGFDIGIASSWRNDVRNFTPRELMSEESRDE